MKLTGKTYTFIKGIVKAGRKKIEPRDRYFEDKKGNEIDYGSFMKYIKKAGRREMNYIYKLTIYNKKEDKKQCKKGGYIADYYDNF